MGSPMAPSLMTLSDLKRSKSRSLRLQSLISHRGAELDHMLLLTVNRKPYTGVQWYHIWPRVTLWGQVKVTYILSGRIAVCFTYICQYCITSVIYMPQKGFMQAGGISCCPRGLSCNGYFLANRDAPSHCTATDCLVEEGSFPLCYGHFLSKNSSKKDSQGLNTMKETSLCPGIKGKASYR